MGPRSSKCHGHFDHDIRRPNVGDDQNGYNRNVGSLHQTLDEMVFVMI